MEFSGSPLTIFFVCGISAALPLIFLLKMAYWGNRKANLALMVVLIHVCCMAFLMLLSIESKGSGHPAFLALFDIQLWTGPLLYFYSRALMDHDFYWRQGLLFHLLPAVAGAVIWILQLPLTESDWLLGPCAVEEGCNLYWRGRFIHKASYAISIVIYTFMSLRLLSPYRRHIKKTHSDIGGQSLVWLQVFLFFYLCSALFSIVVELGGIFWGPSISPQFSAGIGIVILVFLTMLLVICGIRQPDAMEEDKGADSKYRTSSLKDADAKILWKDLLKVMDDEKPYLENGLKISKLAQQMQVSVHDLSKTINVYANQNFYDFINKYRIDEAVLLLGDATKVHLSVTDIAYQSGFNSSSTFFDHFKKRLQLTPRQYRVQQAKRQAVLSAT